MREFCELRVLERYAHLLFKHDEGVKLGDSVRKITLATDDPRFEAVGRLHEEMLQTSDQALFYGWIIRRRYPQKELGNSALFSLNVTTHFEPAGEECGTGYSAEMACPVCGADARQVSPLFLPERRIPKSKWISRTIANEVVVSRSLVELFQQNEIIGAEFRPILSERAPNRELKEWYQLCVVHTEADVVAPTRVGINPFDMDEKGEYRCLLGDTIGLNLLSEVSIAKSSLATCDIFGTRQFVGTRRGLLRPKRIILISSKLYRLLVVNRVNGIGVEIAHLV